MLELFGAIVLSAALGHPVVFAEPTVPSLAAFEPSTQSCYSDCIDYETQQCDGLPPADAQHCVSWAIETCRCTCYQYCPSPS